jgi:hypothetical protein
MTQQIREAQNTSDAILLEKIQHLWEEFKSLSSEQPSIVYTVTNKEEEVIERT